MKQTTLINHHDCYLLKRLPNGTTVKITLAGAFKRDNSRNPIKQYSK